MTDNAPCGYAEARDYWTLPEGYLTEAKDV